MTVLEVCGEHTSQLGVGIKTVKPQNRIEPYEKKSKKTVLTGKVNFESKTEPNRSNRFRFRFRMNKNRPEPNRFINNKLINYIYTHMSWYNRLKIWFH